MRRARRGGRLTASRRWFPHRGGASQSSPALRLGPCIQSTRLQQCLRTSAFRTLKVGCASRRPLHHTTASRSERRRQTMSCRVPDRPTHSMTARGRDGEGHALRSPGSPPGKRLDHAQCPNFDNRGCRRRNWERAALRQPACSARYRVRPSAAAAAIRAVLQVDAVASGEGGGLSGTAQALGRHYGLAGGRRAELDRWAIMTLAARART